MKKYHREWYHAHLKEQRIRRAKRQKRRRLELKKLLDEIKTKTGCIECGYKKHAVALQFHHRNPKIKSFGISAARVQVYSEKRILEEIKKCDVLCANCHEICHHS